MLGALLLVVGSVWSRLRERREPPALSSDAKVLLAHDLRVHYSERGPSSGQAILFVHGTGAHAELWRDVMTWFAARGYRTIAVDLPPFGFSEKPNAGRYGNTAQAARIVSLLDQLGIERVVLFGHSFGGGATLETALRIPGRVQSLVLEDIGGLHLDEQREGEAGEGGAGSSAMKWLLGTPTVRDPLLALTATNPFCTRRLLQSMVFDPKVVSDEHVAILQSPLTLRGGTHAFGDWLNEALYPTEVSLTSDRANYSSLTMPVLILWGREDTIIPLDIGKKLASLLPNSRLEILPNVNHIPHIENFAAVTELSSKFFDTVGSLGRDGAL